MLIDREPPLLVQRQPIRSRLVVLTNVEASVAALGPEHGDLAGSRHPEDRVVVGRAEQEVPFHAVLPRHPHRSFSEGKAVSHSLHPGIRGNDLVQRRIHSNHVPAPFPRLLEPGRLVEIQRGGAHPNEVAGRVGQRSVGSEDRKLDALTGFDVLADDQAIRGVESLDQMAASLPEHQRQPAVHPDLRVIVDHDFEDGCGAGRIERADPVRNRHVDAIPVEAEPAGRTTRFQTRGLNPQPA